MLPFRYRASYQPSDQIQASRRFNEKELASEESNYYVVHIHSSGLLALKATERWWNQYSSSEACKGLNRVHCGVRQAVVPGSWIKTPNLGAIVEMALLQSTRVILSRSALNSRRRRLIGTQIGERLILVGQFQTVMSFPSFQLITAARERPRWGRASPIFQGWHSNYWSSCTHFSMQKPKVFFIFNTRADLNEVVASALIQLQEATWEYWTVIHQSHMSLLYNV